jgi:hypothetical protein
MEPQRIHLELLPTEAAVLDESISSLLTEMRDEIAHTDDAKYRAGLHARLEALERILHRLEGDAPS